MTDPAPAAPSLDNDTLRKGRGVGLAHYARAVVGLDPPEHQLRWLRDLDCNRRTMILGPRSHGHTTTARVVIGHRILTGRVRRVLLVGTSVEVRDLLEVIDGDLVRADHVPAAHITCKRIGQRLGTEQYDLVVADVDQVGPRVHAACDLVAPDGEAFVFATGPRGPGARVGRGADGSSYTVVRDRAIVTWPDLGRTSVDRVTDAHGKEMVEVVHVPADAPGLALWPERWSVEALLKIRLSVGPEHFDAQFQ